MQFFFLFSPWTAPAGWASVQHPWPPLYTGQLPPVADQPMRGALKSPSAQGQAPDPRLHHGNWPNKASRAAVGDSLAKRACQFSV
ncbi:hypothetical protein GJAV_G00137250, partial [Gymnothorax javanicus]